MDVIEWPNRCSDECSNRGSLTPPTDLDLWAWCTSHEQWWTSVDNTTGDLVWQIVKDQPSPPTEPIGA